MKIEKALALFTSITNELINGDQRRLAIWQDLIDAAKAAGYMREFGTSIAAVQTDLTYTSNAQGLILQFFALDSVRAVEIFNAIATDENAAPSSRVNALINLGNIKKAKNEPEAAKEKYLSAARLAEKNPGNCNAQLACALVELANFGTPEEQLACNKMALPHQHPSAAYRVALSLPPSSPKFEYLLRSASAQGHSSAMIFLAQLLLTQGKIEEAKEQLEMALDLGYSNERSNEFLIILLRELIINSKDTAQEVAMENLIQLFLNPELKKIAQLTRQQVCDILQDQQVLNTPHARYQLARLAEQESENQYPYALYQYERSGQLGKDVESDLARLITKIKQDSIIKKALNFYLYNNKDRILKKKWQPHALILTLIKDNLELVFKSNHALTIAILDTETLLSDSEKDQLKSYLPQERELTDVRPLNYHQRRIFDPSATKEAVEEAIYELAELICEKRKCADITRAKACELLKDPCLATNATAQYWLAQMLKEDPNNSHQALYHYDQAYCLGHPDAEIAILQELAIFSDRNPNHQHDCVMYYLKQSNTRILEDEWLTHPELFKLIAKDPFAKEKVAASIAVIKDRAAQLEALKKVFDPKEALYQFFATPRFGSAARAEISTGVFSSFFQSGNGFFQTEQIALAQHILADSHPLLDIITEAEKDWLRAELKSLQKPRHSHTIFNTPYGGVVVVEATTGYITYN